MLWPGYYRSKTILKPILTEIPKIKIDPDQEPESRFETLTGNIYVHPKNRLVYANGIVGTEDFGAGETEVVPEIWTGS